MHPSSRYPYRSESFFVFLPPTCGMRSADRSPIFGRESCSRFAGEAETLATDVTVALQQQKWRLTVTDAGRAALTATRAITSSARGKVLRCSLFWLTLAAEQALAWQPCPMTLEAMVNQQRLEAPQSMEVAVEDRGNYVPPTPLDWATASSAVTALADRNEAQASVDLASIGMAACKAQLQTGATDTAVVVYDPKGFSRATSRGWPLLALRDDPVDASVATILSVPHLVSELNVGIQAVESMHLAGAAVRAAVFAPVHRCNRPEAAPAQFQGTTEECGGLFRISDMAHTQESIFHAMHVALLSAFPRDYLVQIHGMSAPGTSVSNGTVGGVTMYPEDASARLHASLGRQLAGAGLPPENLTACFYHNGFGGDRFRELLCGTRNAQLRELVDRVEQSRFIHIEQEKGIREDAALRRLVELAFRDLAFYVFSDGFQR